MILQHPHFKSADPIIKKINDINSEEMVSILKHHYLFSRDSLMGSLDNNNDFEIKLEKIDRLYVFDLHYNDNYVNQFCIDMIFRLDDGIIPIYVDLRSICHNFKKNKKDEYAFGSIIFCRNGNEFMKKIYTRYVSCKERLWRWDNFISKILREDFIIPVNKRNTISYQKYYLNKLQHPNFISFDPMIICIRDIDEEIFSHTFYHTYCNTYEHCYMKFEYDRKTPEGEKKLWDQSKLASFKINSENIDRVYYVNSEFNFVYCGRIFKYYRGPLRIIVRLDYEESPLYVDLNINNNNNKHTRNNYIFISRNVNEFIKNCVMERGKKWDFVREFLKRDVNIIVRNENMYL